MKQAYKTSLSDKFFAAAGLLMGGMAAADLPEVSGCDLNPNSSSEVTMQHYMQFRECVNASSSLPHECRVHALLATGISCIERTESEECGGIFMFGSALGDTSPVGRLLDSLLLCSVESSEWNGASQEKKRRLLNQYARCLKPIVRRFKSENSC